MRLSWLPLLPASCKPQATPPTLLLLVSSFSRLTPSLLSLPKLLNRWLPLMLVERWPADGGAGGPLPGLCMSKMRRRPDSVTDDDDAAAEASLLFNKLLRALSCLSGVP